ncbi:MAG: hypothetical protein HQL49_12225 [Gammaproteobacteria bacterium]|nr:hypothetical protein [Gammaproteobacteria bacterium]
MEIGQSTSNPLLQQLQSRQMGTTADPRLRISPDPESRTSARQRQENNSYQPPAKGSESFASLRDALTISGTPTDSANATYNNLSSAATGNNSAAISTQRFEAPGNNALFGPRQLQMALQTYNSANASPMIVGGGSQIPRLDMVV